MPKYVCMCRGLIELANVPQIGNGIFIFDTETVEDEVPDWYGDITPLPAPYVLVNDDGNTLHIHCTASGAKELWRKLDLRR